MRRQLLVATGLASTVVLLVAIVSVAMAQRPTVVRSGNLILKVNGGVTPKRLSKKKLSPITLRVGAGIGTADGAQPPVARKVTIEFDKHGAINAHHLTTCRLGAIESRTTSQAKSVCRGAIVGGGSTSVRVAFPESTPFTANGPLVLFNGGVHHGFTTLYVHAYVSVPAPTAIVTAGEDQEDSPWPIRHQLGRADTADRRRRRCPHPFQPQDQAELPISRQEAVLPARTLCERPLLRAWVGRLR